MSRIRKILVRLLSGKADAGIRFEDLLHLLHGLGFTGRVRGSHRIFTREGVEEIICIQPLHNGHAKSYQVKQVRNVILRYGLGDLDAEV